MLLLYLWSALVAFGAVSFNFVDWLVLTPILAVLLLIAAYLTLHPWIRRARAR